MHVQEKMIESSVIIDKVTFLHVIKKDLFLLSLSLSLSSFYDIKDNEISVFIL